LLSCHKLSQVALMSQVKQVTLKTQVNFNKWRLPEKALNSRAARGLGKTLNE